ncbi:MAG: hypothetical protein ABIT37_24110 [Luteolibacter sp.]
MMLAATSIPDVIAIMVVAVTLFFIGVGVVALFKFLLRVIRGKPGPTEPQSVCVYFQQSDGWNEENAIEIQRFGAYLESRIRSGRLGEFDGGEYEENGALLYFYGPDAEKIWERIAGDVRAYAPAKPLEVRFDFGKKRGGKKVVSIAEDGPRQPQTLPEFEVADPVMPISPGWARAWMLSTWLTWVGLAGLFLCWLGQLRSGVTEKEMMHSEFGSFVVFTLSGMFVGGMALGLICSSHLQRIAKRPSPGPVGRAMLGPELPAWIFNKGVLAIVAVVITGVLLILLRA